MRHNMKSSDSGISSVQYIERHFSACQPRDFEVRNVPFPNTAIELRRSKNMSVCKTAVVLFDCTWASLNREHLKSLYWCLLTRKLNLIDFLILFPANWNSEMTDGVAWLVTIYLSKTNLEHVGWDLWTGVFFSSCSSFCTQPGGSNKLPRDGSVL